MSGVTVNIIRHCKKCNKTREFVYLQGGRKKECCCNTCGALLAEAQTASVNLCMPFFAGESATKAVIVDMMPEENEHEDS